MRTFWSNEEMNDLRKYYLEMGLSISEFYDEFVQKYPNRTRVGIEVKLRKMKLKHTKEQIIKVKSRLNSGNKNGMYGKIGPNRGLTKENSERMNIASKKISETRKRMYKDGLLDVSGEKNGMYGKESWCKGKTKYTSDILKEAGQKLSIHQKERWKTLSDEQKNIIIGQLTLAANKARKDTKIELIVRDILEKLDMVFIKNHKCNRFVFDFYLPEHDFVIECQGDYWHANPKYFKKLNEIQQNNIKRDKNKVKYLKENKINSLFLWEDEIYRNIDTLDKIILEKVNDNN